VGDHRIDLDLSVHVPVDDLGNVGAALGPAKGGAAPIAAGDELEGARGDLLARLGHADDDAGAPTAMARLERSAHHFGVAGAIEGEVRAAIGEREDLRDGLITRLAATVDEIGHAEAAAPFLAVGIDIDADD